MHSDEEKFQKIINKGLLKQLSIGMEPLLLQLIADEKLIEECVVITKDLRHTESKVEMFAIFCCLVLKKLMHSNTQTRNLWLNESTNILHWLFLCVCNGNLMPCSFILYMLLQKNSRLTYGFAFCSSI